MNRRQLALLLFLLLGGMTYGQSGDSFHWSIAQPPLLGVKTNLLYDATMTANLGLEVRLSRRYTLDLPVSYNAWSLNEDKKWKHFLVQPELRRWLSCESFYGHFIGLHGIYIHYNVGGVKMPFGIGPEMETHRYQGDGYGAGLSYGYQWLLSSRWSLEASVGAGYARLVHDKYKCGACGEKVGAEKKHYIGPTKAALSLIYIIK